jgi:four helix bundle protein
MGDRPMNLEPRTEEFAAKVRRFVRVLPRTISNIEDVKQLVRASGSVAANCIEGNEGLGAKDRVMRFRICRKEAKECGLWIRLIYAGDDTVMAGLQQELGQEALELKLIFSAIIKKLE